MDKLWRAAALRRMRMLARKKIAGAAEAVGVSEALVSQWELGYRTPNNDQMEALAVYYDIPFDTFLAELGHAMPNARPLPDWYRARFSCTPGGTITAPTTASTSGRGAPGGDKAGRYAGRIGPAVFAPALSF